MKNKPPLADVNIVRIVQNYYDAVDSLDGDRLAGLYYPAPTTLLQFNADEPIMTIDAIREFTNGFGQALAGIEHTKVEVWTNPLMGDVVPVDLLPGRPASSVTVVSTALPIFSVGEGAALKRIALPATSIFTIDVASEKFISVHNMFDISKVYAAVQG
ncbi:ketosteroid isomerase family protein [Dyella acidisoli]|uniref:Nuclear transport factor 2 domain-containing protein n=1 Tax=Dyella acidisoli TaxID=1867834 RepID=A0ABQ5XM42_9GAMM|nr:ketosteroid isomerase family protein [Dyella acidisoli]GLQ91641.1 hypothetical protein GCM10007901_05910 [Dyella acidisoli]